MQYRILSSAVAAVLMAAVSARAETTVVFNNYLSEQNEIMRNVIRPWADAVEQASNAEVKIDFTASSMAPPPRQLEMIRSGVADAAMNISSFTASQWIAPIIAELPVLFEVDSAEQHSVALWRTYEKYFREAENIEGVHVVALFALSGNHVWNNKRPIKELADAHGIKLRVNPNGTAVVEAMGGVVISRPAVESFEIITRGVADGTVLPISSVEGLGVLKELKYATLYPGSLYRSTGSIVFNRGFWDSIPDAEKTAIEKVSGEALARLGGANLDRATEETRAKLQDAGVDVFEADMGQIEALRESKPVVAAIEEWKARAADLGLEADEVIEFYREQLQQAQN